MVTKAQSREPSRLDCRRALFNCRIYLAKKRSERMPMTSWRAASDLIYSATIGWGCSYWERLE